MLQKYLKGFERMELVATASQLGSREPADHSDHVLNLEDFKSRAVFPDEIGRYNYAVDIHAAKPDLASYRQYADDFRNLRYGKGELRCRTAASCPELTNVLVAGRCVSTDAMQSSIRVMPGCFIWPGDRRGRAICAEKNCDTRFPVTELQRRLKGGPSGPTWRF